MIRWRSRFAQFSLLMGLGAWLVVSFVAIVHDVLIQHVVCAEHGEVLELDIANGMDSVSENAGPEIRSGGENLAEEHGCLFEVVFLEDSVLSVPLGTLKAWSVSKVNRIANAQAPRGPPLVNAPKTGPPLSLI